MDYETFNEVLSDWRAGKLPDYTVHDLRSLSCGCVLFIQNGVPDAVHLKATIDAEICRKEGIETELRAAQRHEASIALDREKLDQFSKIRDQIATIQDEVATVDGRLASVEREAVLSEFRRWSFWIAVIAALIALAALFRDYRGWHSSAPVSPGSQQTAPQPPATPTAK